MPLYYLSNDIFRIDQMNRKNYMNGLYTFRLCVINDIFLNIINLGLKSDISRNTFRVAHRFTLQDIMKILIE